MQEALTLLAVVAREKESVDDERHALSQLVMIVPQQVEYADRLRELNEQFGFEDTYSNDSAFDSQFMKPPKSASVEPELETFEIVSTDESIDVTGTLDSFGPSDFAIVAASADAAGIVESEAVGTVELVELDEQGESADESDDERLLREVDSIRFYIDSGYLELASKAISELRLEFGERSEIDQLTTYLESQQTGDQPEAETTPVSQIQPEAVEVKAATNGHSEPKGFGIDDLRSELGIDEVDVADDSDYDTHYHTAVAYQEMGLIDEAIREFQEAVGLVQPNDATRRFFHCANLLGHCFMQKSMPNLALTWYQRALETPGLSDEEKQGIWYELAAAYEADGDLENAGRYFEQVYAENINFRDVSQRVRNMALS
jgi:tetratricopeptide (TPR) repeat protein